MSKMKQLNELINEMEGTAKYYLRLVDEFKKILSTEEETTTTSKEPKHKPQKELKLEDVRSVLATKPKMATRTKFVLFSINMVQNPYQP